MRSIKVLKKLINVYYYILAIVLIGGVISLVVRLITGKSIAPKFLDGDMLFEIRSFKVISIMLLWFLLFYIYFKAISLLNKSLDDLSNGNYFSSLVITNFKKTGILFLICGFGELIGKAISNLLFFSKLHLGLDSSVVLFIIIGLFFMFLSEVFKEAKMTKQENELTI